MTCLDEAEAECVACSAQLEWLLLKRAEVLGRHRKTLCQAWCIMDSMADPDVRLLRIISKERRHSC